MFMLLIPASFIINAQNQTKRHASKIKVKQECEITGVVRYKFNDYQGYKVDLGATVIAVPVEIIDSVITHREIFSYQKLAERKTEYVRIQNDFKKEGLSGDLANMVMSFSKADSERLEELDKKMFEAYVCAKSNKSNMALVDASGTFSMSLPYGEYYIVFKSKNRDRGTASELTGRLHFKRIALTSTKEIIECDFDY